MNVFAHRAEARTIAYMAITTAIAIAHWASPEFSPWLFVAAMVMAFAVPAMNHNHSHRPIFRQPFPNRMCDLWFAIFQGHPGFFFAPMHLENHHRFHNGADDITRTWRWRDSNDLSGLLGHPFQFAWAALPRIRQHVTQTVREGRSELAWILLGYAALVGIDVAALWQDWRAGVYVLVLPQVAAMFWLLASNYLQHAHAGRSQFDHSRNFTGWINPLFFNVGYHWAHHHEPDCHWSELPKVHQRFGASVPESLNEPGFLSYIIRVFLIALPLSRFRSRSLANAGVTTDTAND